MGLYCIGLHVAPVGGDAMYPRVIAVDVHAAEPNVALPQREVVGIGPAGLLAGPGRLPVGLCELEAGHWADAKHRRGFIPPTGLDDGVGR